MKFTTAIVTIVLLNTACSGSPAEPNPDALAQDTCSTARPVFGTASNADRNLFTYNVNAPLNVQVTVENQTNLVRVSSISFDSPGGGRATGMLFEPQNRAGLRPGIVLMHGMPGTARNMTPLGQALAQYGAVVIAIDAPFNRRSGSTVRFIPQDATEQIQLIKDLQRAVDYLRGRADVDDARIAYHGTSYGGAMGALFVGIERRLKTAILVVPDGGLVSHYTGPEDAGLLSNMSCTTRYAWLKAMIPIEPIRYIGKASPTPLLVQNGRTDTLVPMADAEALHAVTPQPRTIEWYDAGHGLTQQALVNRHNWLRDQIGLDPL